MSFVSRYSKDTPSAIDWAPLCLSADLTVTEAIAIWRDYFQTRLIDPPDPFPPISCAVVIRDQTLVGLLPDWQLAAALWTDQFPTTAAIESLCILVNSPLLVDDLPCFSDLITAFNQNTLAVLPIWDGKGQRWGLLSIGNLVRQVNLGQVWQKLSLSTVALPDGLLSDNATVRDLGQQCFQHQLSAIPLLTASGSANQSSSASLRCLSLNDYLIQSTIDPEEMIAADLATPPDTCWMDQSYYQARQLLNQQNHDYVLVTYANGELYGWVSPRQWIYSLQPEALLTALQDIVNVPRLVHHLESRLEGQQRQLQQDQHLIQQLLAHNPNLIYLYNIQQRQICYLNYTLPVMVGYACVEQSTQSGLLAKFQQPLLPDRYFSTEQLQKLSPQAKQEFCFELFYPGQISHHFAVELSVFESDSSGQATQLLCIARDISDNRRAEAALQTSEAQLQILINTIADGILIVDQGGTVIYANPMACQMFGTTASQLLQSHLGLAIDPQAPTEISIILRDQSSGSGELKATPIQWQGEEGTLIAIRDVTDRQRGLEQLQASEEEYRNLLETLPNLVWRLSSTGELQDCNQRTLDYLGQGKITVFGQGWQRFIHPDEATWVLKQWRQGVMEGRFFQLEYRLRRADGVYHWQLLQMLPLPERAEQEGYWLASSTDIESLKQAEILVRQQAQQEKLLAAIGQRIRQSLNLDQILRNAVNEVRQTLHVDRVLIYQVYENGTGAAIAESVAKGYLSVLDMTFSEEVFPIECYERYVNGYVYVLTDRETGFVLDCLVDFLAAIEVRAKVVVPIVFGEYLWGLLIAHYCSSSRAWQSYEVQLLQSLGNQLAIAIQQSLLYEKSTQELLERTKAEQKLLDITRLQQAILNGANYSIISVNVDDVILTFNRMAEELLGYSADEVINQTTPVLFHDPEEMQIRASALSEEFKIPINHNSLDVLTIPALRQGVYEGEWTYIAKNGDRFPVNLTVTALKDENNNPIGFVGIASDLRQQKQIETERKTLDFVVKNSTELIVIADLDQKITFLNQAGQNLIGLNRENRPQQSYLT
ncbi:MAG: PAS domain S-box protein, partial [Synechocystis sp.]